jgi:hypothetical protein
MFVKAEDGNSVDGSGTKNTSYKYGKYGCYPLLGYLIEHGIFCPCRKIARSFGPKSQNHQRPAFRHGAAVRHPPAATSPIAQSESARDRAIEIGAVPPTEPQIKGGRWSAPQHAITHAHRRRTIIQDWMLDAGRIFNLLLACQTLSAAPNATRLLYSSLACLRPATSSKKETTRLLVRHFHICILPSKFKQIGSFVSPPTSTSR